MAAADTLLERAAELAEIEQLLVRASRGTGGLVVIEGPAGIGKTRLVEAALELAAANGVGIFRATASELESEYAFGLARELFEWPLAELSDLEREQAFAGVAGQAAAVLGLDLSSPGLGRTHAPETAFEAVHALYWLTANLATRGPVLLVVDDAHWADAGSLRFLHYLGRRVGELPVALLVATRPVVLSDGSHLLGSLLALVEAPLELSPLTEAGVAELVRAELAGEPDPGFVAACLQATDGNVFLLSELLRTLRARAVEPNAVSAASVTGLAPDALRRRVTTQIASMDETAGALARSVAVLGHAELPRAAALAGLDVEAARVAARSLEQAALLAGGRPLRYKHPILAAAVVSAIPPGELADAHARAARLLAADGDSDAAVAAHLLRSEPSADEWTVATLRKAAADASERGAPETAVAYLRRAAAEPPVEAVKPGLLLELGMAETRTRSYDEAIANLHEGLAIARNPETVTALAVASSLASHLSGDYTNAVGVLRGARERIPPGATGSLLALDRYLSALGVLDPASLGSIAGQIETWQRDAREGRLRDPALLALVAGMAIAAGLPGSDWLPLVMRAAEDPELEPFDNGADVNGWAFGWAVTSLEWGDRLEESDRRLTPAIAESRRRGDATRLALFISYRARTRFRLGQLRAAESDCRAAVEFVGGLESSAAFPFVLFDILVEQGKLAEAESLLETVPDEGSPQHRAVVRLMRGRVGLAAGRSEVALAELLAAGEVLEAIDFRHPNLVPWRALAAEAAHASGETELARRLAAEDLAVARACEAPSAEGRALRIVAQVGEPGEASGPLEASCAILGSSPARLDYAHSLTDLGAALSAQGRSTEARQQLRTSLGIAYECGAEVLVERTRGLLVAAGGRPRRPATTGIHALTPAELQVASLAGDGLTNREIAQALFVTLKTVEQHLSSTYAKLGIAGRRELALHVHDEPARILA